MRQIDALKRGSVNIGGADEDNSWSVHIEGAAGEMAYASAKNRFFPGTVNDGKNPDVDGVQVRTRSKWVYELKVTKSDSDHDVFVLVSGRIPSFTVRGWMYGYEAKREEWIKDLGNKGRPAYFPPHSALRPMDTLPSDIGVRPVIMRNRAICK